MKTAGIYAQALYIAILGRFLISLWLYKSKIIKRLKTRNIAPCVFGYSMPLGKSATVTGRADAHNKIKHVKRYNIKSLYHK
jgi:hypothetical protein